MSKRVWRRELSQALALSCIISPTSVCENHVEKGVCRSWPRERATFEAVLFEWVKMFRPAFNIHKLGVCVC